MENPVDSSQPSGLNCQRVNPTEQRVPLIIEGHNLSVEDHARWAHILYNLTILDSLPRRSSSSISYLNASQRRIRWRKECHLIEEIEIQSCIRSTEERIAYVPIQLQNRFQALMGGRRGGRTSGTKSQ